MSGRRSAGLAFALLIGLGLLLGGRFVPVTTAQSPPDRSEVVLVLDFSSSILADKANRDRFAAALERIADRVDATASDLAAGDATMTIIQFAAKASDYGGCVDLRLVGSLPAVTRFSGCLRSVAKAYRTGPDPALAQRIGVDTNYVAAMEAAARHLAITASRPALILFTDGKHDVPGVPVGDVQPARDRLFGSRTPFALLPVGMGLSPTERPALESGLANLRIIRDMPACASGTVFVWPQVVFGSPDAAGNAVAVALQDVTCTFTVAPTPLPEASSTPTAAPTPSPAPTPGQVTAISLTPGDGRIEVSWKAPAITPSPLVDYQVRCRSGQGDWTQSEEGTSLETSAVVNGLANGASYECEVAAVDASSTGPWTAAGTTVTPVGRPSAPAKPAVEALDHAVRIEVPAEDSSLVSGYRYECSDDAGQTWPARIDVPGSGGTQTEIRGLTNGVAYVCRAFASNDAGVSGPSETSDAVRPCGLLVECNPAIAPILGVVGTVSLSGILIALVMLYRGRTRGYVIAVVDVVHTANLGHGSRLGIAYVRAQPGGRVIGIAPDRGRHADIRIRARRGDRFEVNYGSTRRVGVAGEPFVVIDGSGARHELVLRAFRTASAAERSSNR